MVGPYPLPGRPPTGGIEAVATALVAGLRAEGVDPTLVTCTGAVDRVLPLDEIARSIQRGVSASLESQSREARPGASTRERG